MTDERSTPSPEAPVDATPTWIRALQAGLIGLVAGLALHALSAIAIQAGESGPAHAAPRECKKSSPARDATEPALHTPALSWFRTSSHVL